MSSYGMALTFNHTTDLLPEEKEDPICISNPIPPVVLPSDFDTCAQEVADAMDKTHPDIGKTTDQIIEYYGYIGDKYNVDTEDGYILLVHRIMGGRVLSPPALGKPTVLLHHGMLEASDHWLFQYRDRNLAFKLVDAGYDVWLINARGTSYSQGHKTLDSENDAEYWNFSWHEMGVYDLPAVLDKIEEVTGNAKVYYVGFSMGTTAYFVGLSERPELNDRIIAAFLFSPVAFIGRANTPLRLLASAAGTAGQYLSDSVLMGKLDSQSGLEKLCPPSLLDPCKFCTPTATRCTVCGYIAFAIFNFDAPQMNYTNLPNIISKGNSISIKTLIHYTQTMGSCRFQQFDYGATKNKAIYGTEIPPSYNLKEITAKTYFFHGDYDNLAVPEDVAYTQSQMKDGTVLENFRVDWELFNHPDFVVAKDADKLVYNQVVSLIQRIPPT
ncbi:unnamed protein product [Orchesella dallaii]|uniref:Lipase n=1 Tax=Orchesella dallaii TaxID=48710 RepID=A0ABP1PWU2_9HEXA